jgi:hypothetical protein
VVLGRSCVLLVGVDVESVGRDSFDAGPASPASLLQDGKQSPAGWCGFHGGCVQEGDELVVEAVVTRLTGLDGANHEALHDVGDFDR